MFTEYQSKPVVRRAYEVQEADVITPLVDRESTSQIDVNTEEAYRKGFKSVVFKHYEPVSVGDFIVYLNRDDIYHCTRAVFLERNVVPV